MPPPSDRPRASARDRAVALVAGSRLLDPAWYGAQCGRVFGSRTEAAEHWVDACLAGGPGARSPHVLFEPAWLYPGERWRRHAPDPLSFWLSRPEEQERSPHPVVDLERTGPLVPWLAEHDPAELLAAPAPRDPVAGVTVVVEVDRLRRAVQWARSLASAYPDVTTQLHTTDPVAVRVLTAVAAAWPSVRVVAAPEAAEVVVGVGPDVRPPRWPWLEELLAALDDPAVAVAQPLLVTEDFTVAGPLLTGLPTSDAARAATLPLPAPWPAASARRRERTDGEVRLVPASRLVVDAPSAGVCQDADLEAAWWRAAGFDGPRGRALVVREGRRALRWAIDVAAPAWGVRWGDYHFAHSLKDALERLGQWVAVDHPQTRGRASRELDDVVLVVRGLDRVEPPPAAARLLWVISHPDEVTAAEAAAYDVVLAASTTWAADRSAAWGRTVQPLLQCTDSARFHPDVVADDERGRGPRTLFVGNSRGELRSSVAAALATGLDLTVVGSGWPPEVPVAAPHVANDELGRLYASADLVLNDHWEDMRTEGFISNRVFDVLATGARLLSDDVAGLADVVGEAVPTWRDHEDFRRLTTADRETLWPDAATRRRTAARVVAEHSFDARARTLLDLALRVVDRG